MVDRQVRQDQRLKLRPGVQVLSGTDQVGRVDRIVLRPDSGDVEGIVVSGWIVLGHDVFVPIEAVESADPDAVRVRLTIDELSRLPPPGPAGMAARAEEPDPHAVSRSGTYRTAVSGQMEAHAGGQPLRAGQRVVATDGNIGSLDLVLIDPRTDRAVGFVVRKGLLLVRDVIVPTAWVDSVEQDRILLKVPKAKVDALPEYRPDEEIERDVLDVLWYGSRLGPADVKFVQVRALDGIVELTGHTWTERTRRAIEDAVRGVRGVLDVRNHLDTFEALEAAVREAQASSRAPDVAGAETRASGRGSRRPVRPAATPDEWKSRS